MSEEYDNGSKPAIVGLTTPKKLNQAVKSGVVSSSIKIANHRGKIDYKHKSFTPQKRSNIKINPKDGSKSGGGYRASTLSKTKARTYSKKA